MKYSLKLNGDVLLTGSIYEIENAIRQELCKLPEENLSIEVLPIVSETDNVYFQIMSASHGYTSEKVKTINQAEKLFESWVSSVDDYIEDLTEDEVIFLNKIILNNGKIVNTEEIKKAVIKVFTE